MTHCLIFSWVWTTLSAISPQSYARARVSGLVFSKCLSVSFLSSGIGWEATTMVGSRSGLESNSVIAGTIEERAYALLSHPHIVLINVCQTKVVIQHSIACLRLYTLCFLFF